MRVKGEKGFTSAGLLRVALNPFKVNKHNRPDIRQPNVADTDTVYCAHDSRVLP